MEIFSSYPVKKINIEFLDGSIYANGRLFRDIDELTVWVRECEKIHRNPYKAGMP